jgi:hypothetical protein
VSPRRLAALAALALALVTLVSSQLPPLWAVYAEHRGYAPGKVYTGVLPMSAEDAFSYYGWMRQGAEGRVAFVDRYAVEEHARVYVNLFYGALGWVAGATGAPIAVVYALARLVSGALLLATIWWFVGLCFDRPGPRLAAFALAAVSGGWEGPYNWLVRNRGWERLSSPGWWVPEISTYFSTMTIPHFAAAFAVQLLAVGLMILAWREPGPGGRRYAVGAGACLLLLVFFHPYEVVTCAALFALYPLLTGGVEGRLPIAEAVASAIPMGMIAPAVAWNAWLFSRNPAFRAMDEQAVMTTPEPSKLALALGVGLVLAVVALTGLRWMTPAQRAAAAWLLGSLAAAHLPLRFQRRLLGGIQFPIAVLAVFTLVMWFIPWLARRLGGRTPLAVAVVAAVLVPLEVATPYYVRDIDWREIRRFRAPVWMTVAERDLLAALDRAASPGDSVLSSYDLGMYVPGFAGARAYLGHYSLTIDSAGKRRDVARFFDASTGDAWRLALVTRFGIDFVAWTAHERALGGFDPATAGWLSEVARFGEGDELAVLYRVDAASARPNP